MTNSLLVAYGARSEIQDVPGLSRMTCASDAMGLTVRKKPPHVNNLRDSPIFVIFRASALL